MSDLSWFTHRIRMYGRLMLTWLGYINGKCDTMIMAYIRIRHGIYLLKKVTFQAKEWKTKGSTNLGWKKAAARCDPSLVKQGARFDGQYVNRNVTLVGGPGPPLWKIWVRQLGWLFIPNISGKIKLMFESTNQQFWANQSVSINPSSVWICWRG